MASRNARLAKSGFALPTFVPVPTIIILTNRIPFPLHDGGALAMDAMIRGYQQAGWQVHLLAMNTTRHELPPATFKRLYPEIAGFHTVAVDNAITTAGILKNLLLSRKPEHVDRFRSPAFSQALISLLAELKPQVVQLESPFLGTCVPDIRRHAPAAVIVYRMHNVEGQVWGRLAAERSGIKRHYLHLLATRIARYERRLWAAVDLLLPITPADASAVQKAGISTPIEIAPFGISGDRGNLKDPGGALRLYHLGAMDWLPNQEAIRWFLDAVWPAIYARSPELSFHFAGRNMPASFNEKLPAGAFCAGEVNDAAGFVADKNVLIVPLRSGGGIRIKILEAMASGKLVISTEIGMQGIKARLGVHYLPAESAEDFVAQAAWALSHQDEAAAIVASARQLVLEQYDPSAIMARVIGRLEVMIPS